jgi:drug/metabolite transporter (DMT)-like permease
VAVLNATRTPLVERSAAAAASRGAVGMVFVGGSVAVSGTLDDAPLFTAQALRYGAACLMLIWFARRTGQQLHRPRGCEWAWLIGIAGSGLLLFNIALVRGAQHAEPAVLGVAVACVPVVLAVLGPVLDGTRPQARVLLAAVVVTCGAGLVEGVGRTDAVGVLWAAVVFATEAGFTLLAVPVLGRHGAWGVSVHATWLATVLFAFVGIGYEGPGAVARLHADDLLAIGYLAIAVTAIAFVLWYSCVHRIGASRAGLLTGIAPVSAAAVGVALGGGMPSPAVWVGIACIVAGLAIGSR